METPNFTGSQSEIWVAETWNWCLKGGRSYGTESLTCGVGANSGWLLSELN